jgi:dihydrofolate synthase/folylpolyglutamate synthase
LSGLTYAALVRELFPRLSGGIRWGLERTERMLHAVGEPQRAYAKIHVGGTNGKGSVAAMAASALREAGLSTGLYSSPHLCTFRERIQIDGAPISESALVEAADRLWPHVLAEQPSFFEATTAIAFLALAEAGVEAAVIEVGLGGRLDATNVIEPEVVALTNVSLDHVQLLGPTIAAVAAEKAGIIKPGVPVVTAELDATPLRIFAERAAAVGAPFHALGPGDVECVGTGVSGTELRVRTETWGWTGLRTSLAGAHQARNAALAVRALEQLPQPLRPGLSRIRAGFAALRWPGRLQVERLYGRTWVFDVAHNVAGVQALAAAMPRLELPRPLVALVGVLGDKDWRTMLVPLHEATDALVLTLPPTAPQDRRWDPDAVLREVAAPRAEVVLDFAEALGRAHALAGQSAQGSVIVTGSFHTVGDALIALGRAPYGADAALPPPPFAA